MPKVHFVIDPKKEYEYHKLFLETDAWNDLSLFQFQSIKDEARVIKKIERFWDDKDKQIIGQVEAEWRPIEDSYFKLLEEITDQKCSYQIYNVFFLVFIVNTLGFSNPFENDGSEIVLGIGASGAAIDSKFIIAHELFHTHYYYVVSKLGLEKAINTTLIEGTADLALFYSEMKDSLPESKIDQCTQTYQEVRDNWKILHSNWEKRKSFEDYLRNSINDLDL